MLLPISEQLQAFSTHKKNLKSIRKNTLNNLCNVFYKMCEDVVVKKSDSIERLPQYFLAFSLCKVLRVVKTASTPSSFLFALNYAVKIQ